MIPRKNLLQRLTMPIQDLELYYRQRRKERFESGELFPGADFRRAIHPILIRGLRVMNRLSGYKISIISDRRVPTTRPVIFACTHCGWDDPAISLHAAGDHAYMFWGDPKQDYRTMDGFMLDINGCICCDTDNKEDRYIGKETCVRWLERGGNLLIYPEGAWNVTQHLPVMGLFTGAAEMAIRTGADIVPMAFERDGPTHIISVGENIPCAGLELTQKQAVTDALRDVLATLRWECWEHAPQVTRASLPEDYAAQYRQSFAVQMKNDSYSFEDIEATRFRGKAEIAQQEAFAHMEQLMPCRENAFLYNKNLKG